MSIDIHVHRNLELPLKCRSHLPVSESIKTHTPQICANQHINQFWDLKLKKTYYTVHKVKDQYG